MKNNVKNTVEFIYQETAIHFLINPLDENVMINATEMAKIFNKDTRVFLKTDHAKSFIKELLLTPFGINKTTLNRKEIINTNKKGGTWMNRLLALKFASWLDVKFELWVYSTIEQVTFGNYKEHWEAHARQEAAKQEMENLKYKMLTNPTPEIVANYFKQAEIVKSAKATKTKAIRNQLKLF